MRVVPQAALASAAIGLALVLITLSCGRASAPTPQLRPGAAAPSREATKPTLGAILAQIDAYPVPKGVSAETWTMLTNELKRQLVARSKDGKTLSVAPTGASNSVSDLAAVSNAGGTQATVTWTEVLAGDCNNDGQVGIADLQPIAAHYGEASTGPGSPAYLADANGDGLVSITDLQPIAADYSMHIEGYQVWRGHWNGTSVDWETSPRPNTNVANPSWSIDRTTTPPVDARPSYTYNDDISSVADKTNIRYEVTPYGDGAPGVDSIVAIMPPPVTSSLSGTITYNSGGLVGVTVTLTPGGLNATTAADGTYTITGVADGSYTLTPALTGYTFVPTNRSVTVAGANQTGLDFTAQTLETISGTVTFGMSGLAGVTIALAPGGDTATTQADGTYSFSPSVVLGQACTLTPTKSGYGFTPLSRNFTATSSDLTGQDFTAIQLTLGNTPWPKFHGNAVNSGWTSQAAAQTATVKWTHTFNGAVESSPVIGADGTVYVATTSGGVSLYALNPADGSVKWTGGMAAASTASTPAIASDGTIYYGTNDGTVYALNGADGSAKWSRSIGSPPVGSPTIGPDGTIYVGNNGAFYALNPADGTNVWSTMLGNMQSCPAISTSGTIYAAGGSSNVKALNPADGSPLWSSPVGMSTNSSPALSPDGLTVYIGGNNGALYAVNTADGSQKWLFPFGSPGNAVASSPAVDPSGNIYIGNSGGVTGLPGVVAINPAGVQIWQFTTSPAFVESSPAIGFATLYVGCDDGKIYALNTLDGSVIWSYTTGGAVKNSPAIAADGTVYVGSDDNKVYAFGP